MIACFPVPGEGSAVMTVSITNIGNDGAASISNNGIVTGTVRVGTQLLGYEYQNGTLTYLSSSSFSAGPISPDGQWIGGNAYSSPYGNAAYWENGVITDVGSSQATSGISAIDDEGDMAGDIIGSDKNQVAFYEPRGGGMVLLGALNGVAAQNGAFSAATGMNDAEQVVGYSVYAAGSTVQHAFLWQNGVMTDLGSLVAGGESVAFAINQLGDVVGSSDGEAVLWSKGTITALANVAGFSNASGDSINDSDQIVGTAQNASGLSHAMLWQNGTVTDLNSLLPVDSGWVLTGAWSINDSGEIVGSGTYDGVQTSFLLNLSASSVMLPAVYSFEAGTLTTAVAIQAASADVVNNLDGLEAMDKAAKLLSISLTDGGTPTLTISAAQSVADSDALAAIKGSFNLAITTGATGGAISGLAGHDSMVVFDSPASYYQVSRTADGFTVTAVGTGTAATYQLHAVGEIQFSDGTELLAEPSGGQTEVINLGNLQGRDTFTVLGIDAQGDVVGTDSVSTTQDSVEGAVWSNGVMLSTPPLLAQNEFASDANGISSDGWVAGQSHIQQGTNSSNTPSGPPEAVLWQPPATGYYGSPIVLGYLSGDTASVATSVNDQHQAVGVSYSSNTTLHGFLWQNGAMTSLGSLGGVSTAPVFIDDQGRVVGYSDTAAGVEHAFLWQNGTMTDLGGLPAGGISGAVSINRSGEIVGYADDTSGVSHAVAWKNGLISDLGSLTGISGAGSTANAINDQGIVVGISEGHAVAWAGGTLIDLNSLLPGGSGWVLTSANAINDADEIAGNGTYDGAAAAFELTLPTVLPLSAATAAANAQAGLVFGPVTVTDDAAGVSADLDALQSLASNGELSGITLTDSGFGTLSLTAAQLSADKSAIADITGNYMLAITAPSASFTLAGLAGHGNALVESGDAAQYSVTASGNGTGFELTGPGGTTATLSNIQEIEFADHAAIVAATPGSGGTITIGNITELYGAAFGRLPDVPGLAFYQAQLAANPATPLTQYAAYFLSSPEYTGNTAHDYAESTAGDTQFITDLYQNLLDRTPDSGAIPYYLKLIDAFTQGLAAGTAAYAAAELQGHSAVLTYFSQSPEFLGDVSVTASHPADGQHWLILI